jgi:hypothetical protein
MANNIYCGGDFRHCERMFHFTDVSHSRIETDFPFVFHPKENKAEAEELV